MKLVTRIKMLMKCKNVSRRQVYRDTGVSDKAISNWMTERNKPSVGAIKVLADYFGLTLAEFFEEVDEV